MGIGQDQMFRVFRRAWHQILGPGRGQNLVLHEFAHVLDRMPDNKSRADPNFEMSDVANEWRSFADAEFKDLCKRWERKSGLRVVREYGTTNKAELFACSTAAFFERSEELKLCRPR